MPKVTNEVLAGQVIKVAGALVQFDAAGVAMVNDAQAAVLAQLEGYVVEQKAPEKVAEKKAVEPQVTDAVTAKEPKKADKKPAEKKAATDKE